MPNTWTPNCFAEREANLWLEQMPTPSVAKRCSHDNGASAGKYLPWEKRDSDTKKKKLPHILWNWSLLFPTHFLSPKSNWSISLAPQIKLGFFFVLFTPTASPKVCSHHSASAPAQTLSLAGLKSAAYFFPGKKTSLAALPGDCGSTSRGSRVIHVLNPVRIVTKTDQIRPPEVETDKASWGQELSAVPKEACIWTV